MIADPKEFWFIWVISIDIHCVRNLNTERFKNIYLFDFVDSLQRFGVPGHTLSTTILGQAQGNVVEDSSYKLFYIL